MSAVTVRCGTRARGNATIWPPFAQCSSESQWLARLARYQLFVPPFQAQLDPSSIAPTN
jgi:hypothetical protein